MIKINDRQAINIVRDVLRDNLEDPLEQWGHAERTWIHTDYPLAVATLPRIQIMKRGPSTSEIIDIGPDFLEWKTLVLDIWFWTKLGFKWDNGDTYLKDEEFVKEYLDKIWKTIKAKCEWLKLTYKITGLANLEEGTPEKETDSQRYRGVISIRIWYFPK